MRKFFAVAWCICMITGAVVAQEEQPEEKEMMAAFDRNLDSLLHSWYLQYHLSAMDSVNAVREDTSALRFADSVYRERLSAIPSVVGLPYNKVVRNFIHAYTEKRRDKLEVILGLKEYYFPMIEDIFDAYGIPTELKYMAVIESALNPRAVSRAGAVGMWQFMYSTARMYGLTVNSVVDERRDFIKSTYAAARYIKDLHDIYDDWLLAIAAYNCGPGNVNKAIRRSGNKRDYWDIYYRLPRETRGHIPAYIAATYVVNYHLEHGIKPMPLELPLATDTLMLRQDMHLKQVSAVLGLDLDMLRDLNPQYRIDVLPGGSKPSSLTLPVQYTGEFLILSDSIMAFNRTAYFNPEKNTASPTRSRFVPQAPSGKVKLQYTVKTGDNLGYISEWYGVGLSQVRYWNNIYRNLIRVGQKLTVYVDPGEKERYARINRMSFAEKQAMIGKAVPASVETAGTPALAGASDYEVYRVKYGDTLWEIARKYPGVSSEDIRRLNGLSSSRIKVGQQLKIRPKSH